MNAYQPALFTNSAPCLPCCAQPGICTCALLVPPFPDPINPPIHPENPYSSYADAADVISTQVADCLVYFNLTSGGSVMSYSADISTPDTLIFNLDGNPDGAPGPQVQWWASLSLKAGSVLSVSVAFMGSFNCGLYSCDHTLIETINSPSGTPVNFSALASDGEYIFVINGDTTGSTTFQFTVSSNDTMTVNPVIALWDDSGTTRQLDACPKMYLPPLTESTGTWYVNCASAAAEMGANVSCIYFIEDGYGNPGEYTATGALIVSRTNAVAFFGIGGNASINAVGGQTISIAWTAFTSAAVNIYDYMGIIVQALSGSSSPLTSSALPYTGRYILEVILSGGSTTNASFTVTSSGAITVNPIQALYDVGLGCPSRLNCGDSCP